MRPIRLTVIGGFAAASLAAADAPKQHRFTLLLQGSMVTTWSVPRAPFQDSTITDARTGGTCVRWWTEGEGRQEVSFLVRAPARLTSTAAVPVPSRFRKIPWHADRRGTLVVETEPLESCGGTFHEVVGGADGDCGTRVIDGYVGFGAKAGGGPWDNDFVPLYKDCPILPGIVRDPSLGRLDWYVEEPDRLVAENYAEGNIPAVRGKLPPAAAFRNCANKRLTAHYTGTETRNGIVDAQSGDKVPAGGPARWTSTTVVTIDVTYTRTSCGAR